MRELKLVPYTGMSDAELKGVADWLHVTINEEGAATLLANRALHGIAKRYGVSPKFGFRALTETREKMEEGLVRAYVVKNSIGQAIGQATVNHDTELRKQKTWLPPAFDKLLPFIAGKTVDAPEIGGYASAWLHTSDMQTNWEGLTNLYGTLKERTEDSLWTIEPRRSEHDIDNPSATQAIVKAGFEVAGVDYYPTPESNTHLVSKGYLLYTP